MVDFPRLLITKGCNGITFFLWNQMIEDSAFVDLIKIQSAFSRKSWPTINQLFIQFFKHKKTIG